MVFVPHLKSNHLVMAHKVKLPQKMDNHPLLEGDKCLFIPRDHHKIVRPGQRKNGAPTGPSTLREPPLPLTKKNLPFQYL